VWKYNVPGIQTPHAFFEEKTWLYNADRTNEQKGVFLLVFFILFNSAGKKWNKRGAL
jgi:hypothetical protein